MPPAQIPVESFPRLCRLRRPRRCHHRHLCGARQFGVGSAMGLMKAGAPVPGCHPAAGGFRRGTPLSRGCSSARHRHRAGDARTAASTRCTSTSPTCPAAQDDGGRALARHIQQRILEATGLTCSIGVAPNKLLAKLASEFDKPNGISVSPWTTWPARIWPLPCRKVNGIGPRSDEKLQRLGIHTVGDIAARDRELADRSTSAAATARGCTRPAGAATSAPVVTESEPVSISRETTFERDLHAVRDRAELGAIFTRLCEERGRGPGAQGLRRPHHRHQAALRGLQAP